MAARLDRIYEHAKYEHQWKHTTIVNILNVAYDRNTAWKVFFWSVFSCIRTEYGDLWSKFPYSVRIQESGPEKLRIWTLFTQWKRKGLKFHPKWLRPNPVSDKTERKVVFKTYKGIKTKGLPRDHLKKLMAFL